MLLKRFFGIFYLVVRRFVAQGQARKGRKVMPNAKVFCRIDGKYKSCDVSSGTHERLRLYTIKHGRTIQEVVITAWRKHGVSEKALNKYMSENPS